MSYWSGKRVLVTGGAGFIGSHLVEELVRAGADTTVFIRYNSRGDQGSLRLIDSDLYAALRIVAGDLKDPEAVSATVKGQDVVFHLGALIGIPYSYVHPLDYVQTNTIGTTHVLIACREHAVSKLVSFSTSEVYGTARYVPIDEEHPLQGQSPYSASKIAADQMALSFHRSFGLAVAVARPFNTYGPRQPARAVIPTIISQALKTGIAHLGSLTPTRDLLFVQDTVEGAMKIAETDATVGEVVNLGTSREISIGDLAVAIFERLGKEPRIETEAKRVRPSDSEVERLNASTEKAVALLDWRPATSLEDGLDRTIEWVRENLDYFTVDDYHI